MNKTVIGGRIVNNNVKTAVKGNIIDCIESLRIILDNMAKKQNKTIEQVMIDILYLRGKENTADISSSHIMAVTNKKNIVSKELTAVQTFALICVLGYDKDMAGFSDKEILRRLQEAKR